MGALEAAVLDVRPALLFALLAAGCAPAAPELGAPDSEGTVDDSAEVIEDTADTAETGDSADPGETAGTGETADTGEPADTGEAAETWPQQCADVYDPYTLPTFELTIDPMVWSAIGDDCNAGRQEYRPVTFTWNGESVPAHVRLKGNWTWNCSKFQFVISFNEDDPDARFHGLRKLVLDAPWYDRTLLHERLAHPLFERLGLPYSCVNNARLEINGAYYGLYANLERLDREYLERHFDEPDGNLYQAGSQLETNEETGDTSRLQALQRATTAAEIAALVDLDEATSEWAAEAMLPALDNYWAGVEINYYLYDHPSRGFLYLPYDLDLVFGTPVYGDGSPIWSDVDVADPILWEHTGWRKEQLFKTVLADEGWCTLYVEKLRLARAAYDVPAMVDDLEEWDAQISAAYEEDPRKIVDLATHRRSVEELQGFLQRRADYLDAWLAQGGHCPARW